MIMSFTFKKLNVKQLNTKLLLLNNKFTQLDIKSKTLLHIRQKHRQKGKWCSCLMQTFEIKSKLILLRISDKSC